MQKINCKFAEHLLVPANGIEFGDVETVDGVKCHTSFQATWNNRDGFFDDELESVSQKYYNCPFSTIKSIWISRLGRVDDFWNLVKLIKI